MSGFLSDIRLSFSSFDSNIKQTGGMGSPLSA